MKYIFKWAQGEHTLKTVPPWTACQAPAQPVSSKSTEDVGLILVLSFTGWGW